MHRKFRTIAALVLGVVAVCAGQTPDDAQPRAVQGETDERIRELQREGDRLAAQAQSLLGELRALEVQRDERNRAAAEAERAAAEAREAVQRSTDRLSALEQERITRLPDLQTQLVSIYKQGRGRHVRMLLQAGNLRELGRARRAVAAMVAITQRRLEEHRQLLAATQDEHAALERTAAELEALERSARLARAGAQQALDAHRSLIARIETERDLNARYIGELQAAYERLHTEVAGRPATDAPAPTPRPSRGQLMWPVVGPVVGRYGDSEGRLGGTAVRNGIELAAPEGTPVRAAHDGIVGYAGAYTGFGTLVVLDHGAGAYSLYGYLGSILVREGDRVDTGAELGRVGRAPAGPPALYFELRIDGQPVDPVQWFESSQARR